MNDCDQFVLEWKLIYSVIVAGKNARFAEAALNRLMSHEGPNARMSNELPLTYLQYLIENGLLVERLEWARTGNYNKLRNCFRELVHVAPATVGIPELEAIHGIGPKTARFYALWTRSDVRAAALDTHVLKWLRERGYDAPKVTPGSRKRYEELENAFLSEADKLGKTPRDLGAEIWTRFSGIAMTEIKPNMSGRLKS